jgi:hypothetical protein
MAFNTKAHPYRLRGSITNMVMKAGEVISIASGIYEGYDRAGPFIVVQAF